MKQSTAIENEGDSPIERPAIPSNAASITKPAALARVALLAFVWLLAIYQFSETTVDPDLWGHVVFGQQMLKARAVERADIYSWTVKDRPFINHEYGADLILGGTHLLLGGIGILFLKVAIGLLTFGLALKLGTTSLSWPASATALALGAVAVTEISFGFAARPQIFTAFGLAIELWLLRRIHKGETLWALALPLLFMIWINIHGGALAGVGLLGLAAGSTTLQYLWNYRVSWAKLIRKDENPEGIPPQSPGLPSFRGYPGIGALERHNPERVAPGSKFYGESTPPVQLHTVIALWLATLGVFAALCCNPWGPALVRWLVQSVLWLRPEIEEWNPTPFNADHAALFILIGLSLFAWIASRRRRALWELVVCGAFAVLAVRSVRNTPLFGIVALALVPPHLADALTRFQSHFRRLLELWQRPRIQNFAAGLMAITSFAIAVATFTLHKDHPLTMEVPRSSYPTAAIEFMRAHDLQGKVISFFDWGDMIIFQLPDCAPSIDGRLDACYPRPLIAAHWNLYNGEPVDQKVLPIDNADLALLPSKLAGTLALRNRPGWRVVYFDDTAALLARDAQRFSGLADLQMPVQGTKEAALGRAAFPDLSPRSK